MPIACALDGPGARTQLGEWHRVVADVVVTSERVSPGELRLHLRDGAPSVDALVQLARREAACCPFFTFALLIDTDAVVLRVRVPDDAVAVLDAFAAVCRPG